jgi:hypothetical protein
MASRKDNYRVHAVVYGVDGQPKDIGLFETWSGGDGDSDDTPYREGDGNNTNLGGKQTRDAITISRLHKPERDIPIYPWLESRRGRGPNNAVFTKQYVDDEENPIGVPIIRRGTLKKVTDPEADKNSSDPSTFSLELGSNSVSA